MSPSFTSAQVSALVDKGARLGRRLDSTAARLSRPRASAVSAVSAERRARTEDPTMWQLHLIHLNLADGDKTVAAIDGQTASGVLVLLGAITCAALVSSAARLLRQMFEVLRDLLRLLLL